MSRKNEIKRKLKKKLKNLVIQFSNYFLNNQVKFLINNE